MKQKSFEGQEHVVKSPHFGEGPDHDTPMRPDVPGYTLKSAERKTLNRDFGGRFNCMTRPR